MEKKELVSLEMIQQKILELRDVKVMLDRDLAALYEVPTHRLNEAVKRNRKRFPEGFMFRLTKEEKGEVIAKCDNLKSLKYSASLPYAFSEYGVIMLSSILNSERAISLNIYIVQAFVEYKKYLPDYKFLVKKFGKLEKVVNIHDDDIKSIFQTLRYLIMDLTKTKKLPPGEYIV